MDLSKLGTGVVESKGTTQSALAVKLDTLKTDSTNHPVVADIKKALNYENWVPPEQSDLHPWHDPDFTKKLYVKPDGKWEMFHNDGSGKKMDEGWGLQPLQHHLTTSDKPDMEQALEKAGWENLDKVNTNSDQHHWWNDDTDTSLFLDKQGKWEVVKNAKSVDEGLGLQSLQHYLEPGAMSPQLTEAVDWLKANGHATTPSGIQWPAMQEWFTLKFAKQHGWEPVDKPSSTSHIAGAEKLAKVKK